MRCFFITGTDTEIGKTYATVQLIRRAQAEGRRAAGIKPIAAGVEPDGQNGDVAALLAANVGLLPEALLNTYAFPDPISPHLAAARCGVAIDFARIAAAVAEAARHCEFLFVEGVGGWLAPLSETTTVADLAHFLEAPVILVVGMRLGCLNHALLTAEAIAARGLPLAGWIANQIDPTMRAYDENLATLKKRLAAPFLGTIPFSGSGDDLLLPAS